MAVPNCDIYWYPESRHRVGERLIAPQELEAQIVAKGSPPLETRSCTAAFDALNRNPKTKSLTFSADISYGLRDALPDPRRTG
jgi:hypothetical protein